MMLRKITHILIVFVSFVGIFSFSADAYGATYTVCSSGCDYTAIQSVFNGVDLSPGDIIEVRADTVGGSKTYREAVTWGSNDGGTEGNPVILRGRAGDTITLHGDSDENSVDDINTLVDINNINYVEVQNLTATHPVEDGFQVRGTSTGVVFRNATSTYSGNQGFQMEDFASVTYYDIYGANNVDDGFSMHSTTTATIVGATFSGNLSGINKIQSSQITMSNVTVSDNTQDGFWATYDTGGVGGTNVMNNCTFLNNPNNIKIDNDQSINATNVTISGGTYGLRLGSTGSLSLSGVEISGVSNYAISITGANTVATISNANIHDNNTSHVINIEPGSLNLNDSIVYNNRGAGKYAFVARAGSTNSIKNTVFYYNTNGLFVTETGTITMYNSIVSRHGNGVLFSTAPASNVILFNNDFYNNSTNFSGASPTNTNGLIVDPLFSAGVSYDFNLVSTSTLIDSGVDVSLTSDYFNGPIYGNPDIGAYEYQPPYTLGTHEIDPTGNIRIYADGKYRYTTATSSSGTVTLNVLPPEGRWTYTGTTTRPEWLNLSSITWTDNLKTWTASSTSATTTVYSIGDLTPNGYYDIDLDGTSTTTHQANSSGILAYTYSGGYSTHTFSVTPGENPSDTTPPSSFVTISPVNGDGVSSPTSFSWTASSDSGSGLKHYDLYVDGTVKTSSISGTSVSAMDFSCGSHTWFVRAYDNDLNSTDSNTSTFTVSCSRSGSVVRINNPSPVKSISTSTLIFTRNLKIGDSGEDVRQLQHYLNSKGFLVATTGPGSFGNETTFFGTLTKKAVISFQEYYGETILKPINLKKGTGFVGEMTRRLMRD